MRTFDIKKGEKIVDIVCKHGPIGFRELQRKSCLSSRRTLGLWVKRLDDFHILGKDNQGDIVLTEVAKVELRENNGTITIPEDRRKNSKKIITTSRNNESKKEKERRKNAYVILASVAALGNISYRRTLISQYGNSSMTDIRTGKDIDFTGDKSLPGVGVSDFRKNKEREYVQATLDRRILVAYNERFAYLNFTKTEIKQYIDELKNRNDPILKEITISDHQFLSYVYDIDNPNLITLNLEGSVIEENKLRLVVNQEEDKLQFYHYIYYNDTNDHDNKSIKISSKLVFGINNDRTRKLLGLDTCYKNNNNNFSISLWKEKRYIIADPLLREFVIICNQILDYVWWRMHYAYVHKIWPRFSEIHKRFKEWHELVYGRNRRTVDTFLSLDKTKVKLKKLNKKEQNDSYEYAKSMMYLVDESIKENYKKLESERFIQIQQKYKTVTSPLLEIAYPQFLRELH